MISREDFIFTVGYEGSTAVVDGAMKRRYGSLNSRQLAEQGLFKEAVASAVYSSRQEELEEVVRIFNGQTPHGIRDAEELKRTFGIFEVPPGIKRVQIL